MIMHKLEPLIVQPVTNFPTEQSIDVAYDGCMSIYYNFLTYFRKKLTILKCVKVIFI